MIKFNLRIINTWDSIVLSIYKNDVVLRHLIKVENKIKMIIFKIIEPLVKSKKQLNRKKVKMHSNVLPPIICPMDNDASKRQKLMQKCQKCPCLLYSFSSGLSRGQYNNKVMAIFYAF